MPPATGSAPANADKDDLFHVHTLQAAAFCRSQFHGAGAFHQNFTGLALRVFEAEKWRRPPWSHQSGRSMAIRNWWLRGAPELSFKIKASGL